MIRLDTISKQNGHHLLFVEASAAIQRGEKVGLVGPNGAGKTTLFRMITGEEQPDEGQVAVDRGVTIGYFSQDVGEMAGRSAVAEVMDGAGPVSEVAAELRALEAAMADPDRADEMDDIIARYGEAQARFEELDGYALEGRAREVLAGLGFSQEMQDGDVGSLSGGWKMRVALGRILLMRPDAMLLDEPSNHLDIESLIWLEAFLKGYQGALLMTAHDREFMNRIVGKVIEIDGGTLTAYSGNYEFYEQQRALGQAQQQAQFERQQAMLAKEIRFIERFKARASHAAQVQSRVKKLDKIERVEPPRRRQTIAFEFPPAPRCGEDVASLSNVLKRYGSRSIYEGFDFQVRRRERWCVMGINGAGKSTLLRLVAGATAPDDGSVRVGDSVKMGYFAQHAMDLLDGERTVFESLEDSFPQAGQGSLRALAGCFGFSGDDVEKRCRVLSGGEKARLVDGEDAVPTRRTFLVLDEPTNHLDMATKEMLVAALADFEGTMLFVSHSDRRFPGGAIEPRACGRLIDAGGGSHSVWRRVYGVRGAHRAGGAGVAGVRRTTDDAERHAQCAARKVRRGTGAGSATTDGPLAPPSLLFLGGSHRTVVGDPAVRRDAHEEHHVGRRAGRWNRADDAVEFRVALIAQRHQGRIKNRGRRSGDADQRALHLGDGARVADGVASGEHEAANLELDTAGRQVEAGFATQRRPRLATSGDTANDVAGLDDADHSAPLDVLRCVLRRGRRRDPAHQQGGSDCQQQRSGADMESFNESHCVAPLCCIDLPHCGNTSGRLSIPKIVRACSTRSSMIPARERRIALNTNRG